MTTRVAVLITEAFAPAGGVQLVNRNMIKALALAPGIAAEYFSLTDTTVWEQYTQGQTFHAFGGRRAHLAASVWGAMARGAFDLLLVTHRNLFPLAVPWKKLRRPYVVFAHGIEIWDPLPFWYRAPLLSADRVLTNSEYTRNRMCIANGVPPERVTVIPLCPDYFWLREHASEAATNAAAAAKPRTPLLLTVGRSDKKEGYKGQDIVIRALPEILQSFPETRYVSVGGGDDETRLRSLARQTGVEAMVEFPGRVSAAERDELFRRAEVFVMPSRGEGLGLVYLEAMQYRLPCIAGDSDGGRQIITDGGNGFTVDAGNPAAVAAAVTRLLGNAPLRARMGEAGYQMLHTEHSFDRFSAALCSAIERTVSERGGAGRNA